MKAVLRIVLAMAASAIATQATAQVVFYEYEGFQGRTFTADRPVGNFEQYGFNDRASSVVVLRDRWEICSDAGFGGACVVLRAGRYPYLAEMNMNGRISSARAVGANVRVQEERYVQPVMPVYDNRRRGGERLFEAPVTAVRAVVKAAEQRCWVDHDPRDRDRERAGDQGAVYQQGNVYPQGSNQPGNANVPGAVSGAVIGGVLGHQVGGGRGKDVATAIGVLAGVAVGANAGNNTVIAGDGRDGRDGRDRDGRRNQGVQRCVTEQSTTPEYWDVSYVFRGVEHRIQTATPPGPTVTVNRAGEPRAQL